MELTIGIISALAFMAIIFFVFLSRFSRKIESNILSKIQESFGSASLEALDKNSDQFLKLAGERLSKETESGRQELENKKELIDSTFHQMKAELDKVRTLLAEMEKDRAGKFASITKGIEVQNEETFRLQETVNNLNKILSSSQSRGRWGERMAEDILRLAGLTEGINYIKQQKMTTSGNKPDFSFILPQGKIVNMDVKFPFDNYRKYCEEKNESTSESYKKQFLRDARSRIKEITNRDYINPEANTLDYVIVFIPLDQAYSFIMENDDTFIDYALKLKVIVCSPWTLYAYLSVIRQSIDNFNLEKSAGKILTLMSSFNEQWQNYSDQTKKLGDRIDSLKKEYDSLITTRTNQLEKPLYQIEQLYKQREISINGNNQDEDQANHRDIERT